jgi:hypothetical protein
MNVTMVASGTKAVPRGFLHSGHSARDNGSGLVSDMAFEQELTIP